MRTFTSKLTNLHTIYAYYGLKTFEHLAMDARRRPRIRIMHVVMVINCKKDNVVMKIAVTVYSNDLYIYHLGYFMHMRAHIHSFHLPGSHGHVQSNHELI